MPTGSESASRSKSTAGTLTHPQAFEADRFRQEELKLAGIDRSGSSARRLEREPKAVGERLARLLAQRRPALACISSARASNALPIRANATESGKSQGEGLSRGRRRGWRRNSRALGSAGSDSARMPTRRGGQVACLRGLERLAPGLIGRAAGGAPGELPELVQEGLEGGLALAPVEGGEGVGADAGLGEADARGEAGGGEVALVRLDRFQGLLLGAALEPRAAEGERRRRRGGAPVRPPRAGRARRRRRAARPRARAAASRRRPRPWPAARRRRTPPPPPRRGTPSPPGCPGRRRRERGRDWRRRRPWPGRPGPRARPRPPPGRGSAGGTGRTTRPRSRPPPASAWRHRGPRPRSSLRSRRRSPPELRASGARPDVKPPALAGHPWPGYGRSRQGYERRRDVERRHRPGRV